ncbi:MAG: hypothetical protein MK081_03775 [Flavobacteriales bacterium]|nr:hypothetical protein [Flavobacteriales bacterium]
MLEFKMKSRRTRLFFFAVFSLSFIISNHCAAQELRFEESKLKLWRHKIDRAEILGFYNDDVITAVTERMNFYLVRRTSNGKVSYTKPSLKLDNGNDLQFETVFFDHENRLVLFASCKDKKSNFVNLYRQYLDVSNFEPSSAFVEVTSIKTTLSFEQQETYAEKATERYANNGIPNFTGFSFVKTSENELKSIIFLEGLVDYKERLHCIGIDKTHTATYTSVIDLPNLPLAFYLESCVADIKGNLYLLTSTRNGQVTVKTKELIKVSNEGSTLYQKQIASENDFLFSAAVILDNQEKTVIVGGFARSAIEDAVTGSFLFEIDPEYGEVKQKVFTHFGFDNIALHNYGLKYITSAPDLRKGIRELREEKAEEYKRGSETIFTRSLIQLENGQFWLEGGEHWSQEVEDSRPGSGISTAYLDGMVFSVMYDSSFTHLYDYKIKRIGQSSNYNHSSTTSESIFYEGKPLTIFNNSRVDVGFRHAQQSVNTGITIVNVDENNKPDYTFNIGGLGDDVYLIPTTSIVSNDKQIIIPATKGKKFGFVFFEF